MASAAHGCRILTVANLNGTHHNYGNISSALRRFGVASHPLTLRIMNSASKGRFLGLVGLASIAVWLTLSLGNAFYLCFQSLRWPTVPVRVISSGVSTGTSNIGQWWAPDVKYEYDLAGHEYESSSIRYMMPVFYHEEQARLVQASYPAAAHAVAAYNPQNPAQSVLEPGVPSGMWLRALIPLFFWSLTGYIYWEINHPERRVMLLPDMEAAE